MAVWLSTGPVVYLSGFFFLFVFWPFSLVVRLFLGFFGQFSSLLPLPLGQWPSVLCSFVLVPVIVYIIVSWFSVSLSSLCLCPCVCWVLCHVPDLLSFLLSLVTCLRFGPVSCFLFSFLCVVKSVCTLLCYFLFYFDILVLPVPCVKFCFPCAIGFICVTYCALLFPLALMT